MTAPLSTQVQVHKSCFVLSVFLQEAVNRGFNILFSDLWRCVEFFLVNRYPRLGIKKKNEAITMAVMWGIMDPDEP